MEVQKWSDSDFSLEEIVQNRGNQHPFRIKISQGYCQEDTQEGLAFSKNEIYKVQEVEKRKTIFVARKDGGTEYSIDETDPRQFLVVTKHTSHGPMRFQEILQNYSNKLKKVTLLPEYDVVKSKDCKTSGSLPRCVRNTELKVKRYSEEKYLKVNLILEDSDNMHFWDRPILMPMGVGIRAHREVAAHKQINNEDDEPTTENPDSDRNTEAEESQFIAALVSHGKRKSFNPLTVLKKFRKRKKARSLSPKRKTYWDTFEGRSRSEPKVQVGRSLTGMEPAATVDSVLEAADTSLLPANTERIHPVDNEANGFQEYISKASPFSAASQCLEVKDAELSACDKIENEKLVLPRDPSEEKKKVFLPFDTNACVKKDYPRTTTIAPVDVHAPAVDCQDSSLTSNLPSGSFGPKPQCTVKPTVHSHPPRPHGNYITLLQNAASGQSSTSPIAQRENRLTTHAPPPEDSPSSRQVINDQYLTLSHNCRFYPRYVNEISYAPSQNRQIRIRPGLYVTFDLSGIAPLNEQNRAPNMPCNQNGPMPDRFGHGMYLTITRSRDVRPWSVSSEQNLDGFVILPSHHDPELSVSPMRAPTSPQQAVSGPITSHRFSFTDIIQIMDIDNNGSSMSRNTTSSTDSVPTTGSNIQSNELESAESSVTVLSPSSSFSNGPPEANFATHVIEKDTNSDGSLRRNLSGSSSASEFTETDALSMEVHAVSEQGKVEFQIGSISRNSTLSDLQFTALQETATEKGEHCHQQCESSTEATDLKTNSSQSNDIQETNIISLHLSSDEMSFLQNEVTASAPDIQLQKQSNSSGCSDTLKSLSEITCSVNSLSIQDLAGCLKLLNMAQHADTFVSNQIDGKLAGMLDTDILIRDFSFTRFEALKFHAFVRDGWRPKKK